MKFTKNYADNLFFIRLFLTALSDFPCDELGRCRLFERIDDAHRIGCPFSRVPCVKRRGIAKLQSPFTGQLNTPCRIKLLQVELICRCGIAAYVRHVVGDHAHRFVLDRHHDIEAGRVFPVCGNTWRTLHDTRFREYFEFIGDFICHYGLFGGCGGGLPFGQEVTNENSGYC
jgi:hypothetical protein